MSSLLLFSARYLIFLLFTPLVWIWFKLKDKPTVLKALISTGIAIFIAEAIKLFFPTPRPFINNGTSSPIPILGWAPESSFPSTHTSGAFALAVSVLIKYRKLGIVLIVLATIVGLSRIFIGVHYWWDILGGVVLGSLVSVTVVKLFPRLPRSDGHRTSQ